MVNKVFFDITNLCNANCVYCFTNSNSNIIKSSKEMTDDQVERLIDELVLFGIKELSIGGGEPFLRDICKILDYSNGRLDISITTNGTIVNEEIINSLASYDVGVTISLDSLDFNISKLIRTGIDINLVTCNIERLLQNEKVKKNFSLRTTVSRYNMDSLVNMVEFCNNREIKKLKINSVNNFGRAKKK